MSIKIVPVLCPHKRNNDLLKDSILNIQNAKL